MKRYNWLPVLNIRVKIFLLIFIVFSILIASTLWQISLQADRVSAQTIQHSLARSSVILNTKMESRFTSIQEVAKGISRDGRVLPLVYDREALTLQDLSLEFQKALEFDVLFFTDEKGTILARSDRPEAVGASLAGRSPLFDQALSGEPSQGIIVSRERLLQMVVVPIFDNVAEDVVRGTVALAYPLAAEIAAEIHTLTASEVGFFVFTRDSQRAINGVQSTFTTNEELGKVLLAHFDQQPSAWQNLIAAPSHFSQLQLVTTDDTLVSSIQRFNSREGEPLGFVMATQSRSKLLAPFVEIEQRVLIIGAACLLAASLIALLFAFRISRPIIELVALTRAIQDGRYPGEHVVRGGDEIGMLYDSLVRMGNTLREKAELEQYLASMSDEMQHHEPITLAEMTEEIVDANPEDQTVVNSHALMEKKTDGNEHSPTTLLIDNRYKVLARIGAGAIGTVYLAQDLELDEKVAVKVMQKSLFSQTESINFKEEIRLARQVTHRNILRIFDYGIFKNVYYITMEYVSGYDLDLLIRTKGALKPHIGISMVRQICSAMNAAHEQGIIHRDLKPSNMMINSQGILKIMDFGLALKVGSQLTDSPALGSASPNAITTVVGTPRYMAPEQFFNWALDERTDIYAIGVLMYTIFTGQPPFTHKDFVELGHMHLRQPVPETPLDEAHLPEHLRSIIRKCLEKKPEDRYQKVQNILEDLSALH